jgi:hypothetical protein
MQRDGALTRVCTPAAAQASPGTGHKKGFDTQRHMERTSYMWNGFCFKKTSVRTLNCKLLIGRKRCAFWDITERTLFKVSRRFGGKLFPSGCYLGLLCNPEDEGDMVNVGIRLPDYTAIHPRLYYTLQKRHFIKGNAGINSVNLWHCSDRFWDPHSHIFTGTGRCVFRGKRDEVWSWPFTSIQSRD